MADYTYENLPTKRKLKNIRVSAFNKFNDDIVTGRVSSKYNPTTIVVASTSKSNRIKSASFNKRQAAAQRGNFT